MAFNWVFNVAHTIVVGNPVEANKLPQNKSIAVSNGKQEQDIEKTAIMGFQMPLHYPRYTKADYQNMEEWKLDALLREYGLVFQGTVDEKRRFAMGAFLWPDQL
ncbi:PREDICTED: uncharacterized protein LOC109230476 [Nicotiana attenuata]|uniref:DUF7722 domain-containing protein n=1 Tax=Nicotiana attenuata TaxID=49451 RepID=A0A1J6IZQ5_NICAT|nr:PREDICTED: uncharacterized protein LOC109230476 [Nicotiana attenuata]OIT00545.1 hypothetical protein A4A49_33072 [Nicotiana attenuata]